MGRIPVARRGWAAEKGLRPAKMLTPTSRPRPTASGQRGLHPSLPGDQSSVGCACQHSLQLTGEVRPARVRRAQCRPEPARNGIRALAVIAPRPGTVDAPLAWASSRTPNSTNTNPSLDSSRTPSMPRPARAANSMPVVPLAPPSPGQSHGSARLRNPVDKPIKVPSLGAETRYSPAPPAQPRYGRLHQNRVQDGGYRCGYRTLQEIALPCRH